ncbi:MAG: LPXTG cell wall anchor domain-containing protein [Ruminococcus sp.]|nr:LPXTG cell wall anchor domain-containing protein [Ruminococcus sp.]
MKSSYNRKSSNTTIIAALLLILFVAASLTVLFSRTLIYSQAEFENVMPLMSVHSDAPNNNEDSNATVRVITSGSENMEAHPEFRMDAKAEIFKLSYKNDKGEIIVGGEKGNTDKLIAPGASNEYQFTLKNPGDVALDYTLSMEATVKGTDAELPIKVRVWDYTNKYLLGSAKKTEDVLTLNDVSEKSSLGAGRYAAYTLEWEWPYEQDNDEFDTMLGNLAAGDDIVLEMKIKTTAEYDETNDPKKNNTGLIVPQTGDDTQLGFLWLILAVSIVGIFIVLLADRRKKKQNSGKSND